MYDTKEGAPWAGWPLSGHTCIVKIQTTTTTASTTTTTTATTTTTTATTATATTTTTTTANATAAGDPHLVNMRGQHFDVRRPGQYPFLVVPRFARARDSQLFVQASIAPVKGTATCTGLYITTVLLQGSWLGKVRSLEFSTGTQLFDAPEAVGLKVDGRAVSIEAFGKTVPSGVASLVQYHPKLRKNLNRHVDTLVATVNAGPTTVDVGWAHTHEPLVNWLWINFKGVEGIDGDLGGILGADDHELATRRPEWCGQQRQLRSSWLKR